MTPLEAMAAALEPHVWDNDPDMERFCLRALRTLKASGYELVEIEDPGAEERAFIRDVATDPLQVLKLKAKELRKKQ